jgi:hypothetical protein
MSDTFRSLCVELVDELKLHCNDCEFSWGVIERTKKLLSQSEPEFTAEEVEMIAAPWSLLTPTQSSLEEALRDAIGGLRYIEQQYGRLYGVGWDRVYNNAELLLGGVSKTTSTQSSDYSEPEELIGEEAWYPAFADWLERELPEGTVIGDPLWWASNIADFLTRHCHLTVAPVAAPLPPGYIDPEHHGEDLKLLQAFYHGCQSEGGTADEVHLRGIRAALAVDRARYSRPAVAAVARPVDEWHEDIGPVLWWRFPVEEPPYCGGPLDTEWVPDYYTHFTPLIVPLSTTTSQEKP